MWIILCQDYSCAFQWNWRWLISFSVGRTWLSSLWTDELQDPLPPFSPGTFAAPSNGARGLQGIIGVSKMKRMTVFLPGWHPLRSSAAWVCLPSFSSDLKDSITSSILKYYRCYMTLSPSFSHPLVHPTANWWSASWQERSGYQFLCSVRRLNPTIFTWDLVLGLKALSFKTALLLEHVS